MNDYGWIVKNDQLSIKWDTPENIAYVADVVKQLTSGCGCKKGCETKRWKCQQAHRICSVSCKCVLCENPHQGSGKCTDPKCTALRNTPIAESTIATNRLSTVSASFSSSDTNVIQEVFGDSESDSASDSETDHDVESDNEYDFDSLNQLERKKREICA